MADKYYGLCESCEHDATCNLRRSMRLKIIRCEGFAVRGKKDEAGLNTGMALFQETETARMGLCANCLNVRSCSFPNARCSVMQCEEYLLDERGEISPFRSGYSRSAA